ncbi:cyclopropane-fatty-acyl-phospholipid synthase family protein [Pseudomonas zeae]|jgi:cyclopropane-fatty-acyl-phospholipid synthase|uniref:Class I SAM-dependent methyltransferase n=1 Tax=Pseudomonas germanica TaxID=2815720 RepID=A0ABX8YMB7_9PSED|nr:MULTISPECIES: cyclopropane-fatty-acyl-phospholipid synthase family protein [Pseudomonas]QYY81124.1 class I SAM-dependent methyltransferase [Pseudomonas germanica]UUT11841.1 cyclopropane-fatty-acyl-phospholipid synthase family protein [Pseudomonas zeae]UVL33919.1 cyclopropane-fatty-acyl-phospholipid synthase family protein [Pseudomonas sp. B21-041]WPN73837.1 cyclopropane-fatty-acyl-phospholipid synthase family protein [Pseudomonas germanica]SEP28682.1 cyclopropane-fatty-acyl-phospholipid syn
MKSSSLSVSRLSTNGLTGSLLRRGVLRQLAQLKNGQLLVVEDGERLMFGTPGSALLGEIHVLDPAVWGMVAGNGSIGAGEAFIHGYWSSPDLTAVVRVFVSNLDVLDAMEGGLARLSRPLVQGLHWLNRNTRKGSQKNIAAHYDLGNDLFEQFLDPTMMYSAAQFLTPEDSLEQAQLNKLERICQKLALQPSDHLLEIGTGWGSMALYAAQHYGCRVTTTTLSKEQYAFTAQRIEQLGLQDRVTLLLKDYRDLTGEYDKLVSIEMIEAVGHRFLPTYFKQCAQLLKSNGLMLIQAITIREQRYEQAKRGVDFIQRYIFPGGALPCVQKMLEVVGRDTDMNLLHMEDFGLHYARTLRLWHENFRRAHGRLSELGYDDYFLRLWEFYLCYCEGGFLERTIGTAQLLLAKPAAMTAPLLGRFDA